MAFRVSDNSLFESAIRNIQRSRIGLEQLQIRASTGKRINRISDDPSGASQVLALKNALGRIEQFKRNIDSATANIEAAENALNGVTNVLIRLRELAVSADDPDLEVFNLIQPEVEQLFEQLVTLANSRSGNKSFLFGGFLNGSAPFTASGGFVGGAPSPTVAFGGNTGEIRVQVGESAFIATNLNGSEIFVPGPPSVDIFKVAGDFRDALRTQDTDAIFGVISEFDKAIDQVLNARGIGGARLNRLETSRNQLEALDLTLQKERSAIEDDDFIRTITELQSRELTFEASLAITSRLLQTTLMDFLR